MPQSAPHGRAGLFSHGSVSSVSGLQVAPIGQPAARVGTGRVAGRVWRAGSARDRPLGWTTGNAAMEQGVFGGCAGGDPAPNAQQAHAPSALKAVLVPVALHMSAHCDGA